MYIFLEGELVLDGERVVAVVALEQASDGPKGSSAGVPRTAIHLADGSVALTAAGRGSVARKLDLGNRLPQGVKRVGKG